MQKLHFVIYLQPRNNRQKMEAKESLIKVLKALQELDRPIARQSLIDFLAGKETEESIKGNWDDMETYGIGDTHEEEYWNTVIDAAIEKKHLKAKSIKNNNLVASTKGKKFLKNPTNFDLTDEDEIRGDLSADEDDIDYIMRTALDLKDKKGTPGYTSPKSKLQIKIIQAIDRKIDLDDLAETEHVGLDEVLDEMEEMVRKGKKLDITYFTNEIVGEEYMEELLDYFKSSKKNNLDTALKEFGDVYKPEELRLAYIVFLAENIQ